jgi:hypothetical protein
MKSFLHIFFLTIECMILQFFLPWWIIVPVSFLHAFKVIPDKWTATWVSFVSVFMLWSGMAILSESRSDVSIAQLLGNLLGNISGFAVIILTGVTGGICAGLGGLLGRWMKELFSKPPLS